MVVNYITYLISLTITLCDDKAYPSAVSFADFFTYIKYHREIILYAKNHIYAFRKPHVQLHIEPNICEIAANLFEKKNLVQNFLGANMGGWVITNLNQVFK